MNELTKYIVTSPLFKGQVTFRFDSEGIIYNVHCSDDADVKVRLWFIRNTACTVAELTQMIADQNAKGKQLQLVHQITEVTFLMMYKTYGHFHDKIPAQKIWDKMSEDQRMKAYLYINKFKQKTKLAGTGMKYLKTYLYNQPWND